MHHRDAQRSTLIEKLFTELETSSIVSFGIPIMNFTSAGGSKIMPLSLPALLAEMAAARQLAGRRRNAGALKAGGLPVAECMLM